jgi:hypothetical protein
MLGIRQLRFGAQRHLHEVRHVRVDDRVFVRIIFICFSNHTERPLKRAAFNLRYDQEKGSP